MSYGGLNYKSVNQWTTFHIVYLGGLCFPFSLFVFTHFLVYVLNVLLGYEYRQKNPIVRKKMNGLGSNK